MDKNPFYDSSTKQIRLLWRFLLLLAFCGLSILTLVSLTTMLYLAALLLFSNVSLAELEYHSTTSLQQNLVLDPLVNFLVFLAATISVEFVRKKLDKQAALAPVSIHQWFLNFCIGLAISSLSILVTCTVFFALSGTYNATQNHPQNLSLAVQVMIGFLSSVFLTLAKEILLRVYLLQSTFTSLKRIFPKNALILSVVGFSIFMATLETVQSNHSFYYFLLVLVLQLTLSFLFFRLENVSLVAGIQSGWNYLVLTFYGTSQYAIFTLHSKSGQKVEIVDTHMSVYILAGLLGTSGLALRYLYHPIKRA
ncbi:MAG: hypothetical protein AAF518_20850 [Spirochaetota bacterium]